jgi:hypothetical protein
MIDIWMFEMNERECLLSAFCAMGSGTAAATSDKHNHSYHDHH